MNTLEGSERVKLHFCWGVHKYMWGLKHTYTPSESPSIAIVVFALLFIFCIVNYAFLTQYPPLCYTHSSHTESVAHTLLEFSTCAHHIPYVKLSQKAMQFVLLILPKCFTPTYRHTRIQKRLFIKKWLM